MMLRTLPARSGFLWVLLACIFLAGCTRHPKYSLQTEAVLERLDAELSRKDRYQQWRQAQNDSLRPEGGACPQRRRPGVAACSPCRRIT